MFDFYLIIKKGNFTFKINLINLPSINRNTISNVASKVAGEMLFRRLHRVSPFCLRLCQQHLEQLVHLDMGEQNVSLHRVH